MPRIRPLLAMAGATVLLAAGTAAAATPTPTRTATAPTPGPMPAWMSYDRPGDFQSNVTHGIEVPRRDGGYLSCDLYRPATPLFAPAPGRFPAVMYQFHGYADNRAYQDPGQLNYLAQHGYVGLQCSVRGTGGTPGVFDLLSQTEARDGYDAVEWLAKQDYTDGDVAMMGYSYGAVSAYRVAALRPPHLRTIVPQASWSDLYDDIAHLGGVRGLDVRVYLLGLVQSLNTTTPADQKLPLQQRLTEIDNAWGKHLLDDGFWKQYDIDFTALRESRVPILTFGGWYDIFQRGEPVLYQRLKQQSYLVMDNVSHIETGPTFYGKASGPSLAWLDHWLQPDRQAPLPTSRVTAYQMPAGSGWTELADWPAPGVGERTLHMTAAGALSSQAGSAASTTYTVDPYDGMPNHWNTGSRPDSPQIVAWSTAKESKRTHFATAPLTSDLVVTGSPHAVVDAAFTADDGYLVARLSDVAPDGTVTLVSTGWLQASLGNHTTRYHDVVPGQRARYDVEIWPVNWRFKAGHRLQVSISSGDVPRIHADAPSGDVTVFTGRGASTLTLPVA